MKPERQNLVWIFLLSCFLLPLSSFAGDGFFYYEDENGVLHFTDQKPQVAHERRLFSEQERNAPKIEHRKTRPQYSRKEIRRLIRRFSTVHELPPALVEAVVMAESAYDPYAVSRKGARGLMQLMPQTAEFLGVRRVHNPEENLNGGILYLSQLLKQYRGNLDLSLAAYNAGPNAVRKYGGVPPYPETTVYIERVKKFYERLLRRDIRSVIHAVAERNTAH